jgi:hypothetical protein
VYVERQAGAAADGLHHGQPKTQVGHEVAIHDVEVQRLRPGPFDAADFLAQLGEVAG